MGDRAIDPADGVGQTALRKSVRVFLGLPSYLRSLEHIEGLVGWAALRNAKPWDHIDLSELHNNVNAILGYRPLTPIVTW
ncbi:hypothetical protein QF046_000423 [Microbacterium sp. W4I4]|nr:hypothetical protein [Microbacterium sp. W4I4]